MGSLVVLYLIPLNSLLAVLFSGRRDNLMFFLRNQRIDDQSSAESIGV